MANWQISPFGDKPKRKPRPVRKRKRGPCANLNRDPKCRGWDEDFKDWSDEDLAGLSGQTMWGPVRVTR